MSVSRVALVFDHRLRKDTTGVYCRRALARLVDTTHVLPEEVSKLSSADFDLFINIDDGLRYRWPVDLRPSVWWAIDTHLDRHWYREKASDFSLVFAAQRNGAEELRRMGFPEARWLPLACDPDIHGRRDVEKRFDACFVGNKFPGPREDMLRAVQERFPNSFVGQRFFEEMAEMYCSSRVVLNRSIRDDVNMRVFEALASGSLLATNALPENGLDDLFHDGVHLATYCTIPDLLDRIDWYLQRPDIADRIGDRGREEALSRHTYRHRMLRLLSLVDRLPRWSRSVDIDSLALTRLIRIIPWVQDSIPPIARRIHILAQDHDDIVGQLKNHWPETELTFTGEAVGSPNADGGHQCTMANLSPSDSTVDCLVLIRPEQSPAPELLLDFWRASSSESTQLIVVTDNVRHRHILQSLINGSWTDDGLGVLGTSRSRRFTPIEIEKFLVQRGWTPFSKSLLIDDEGSNWLLGGQCQPLRLGNTLLEFSNPQLVEEMHAHSVLLRCRRSARKNQRLVSIIIVTCNQLVYTRLCLESVRRRTSELIEIVVIDNASSDGTLDYLRNQPDIVLIANERNRGFPAAANQGLRVARGSYCVLLNNDCIVTSGWLTRLIDPLESDAGIGLAGPTTNRISGEQQIEIDYASLDELDAFAWKRPSAIREVNRLVGFCLAMPRAVLNRVGFLDEQFGVGCFEDDDFTRRVREAGFLAVIVTDSFVHHFGSRSFVGNGVDLRAVLEANQRLFEDKWRRLIDGKEIAEKPSIEALVDESPWKLSRQAGQGLRLALRRPTISLCMIVRDNAKIILDCLSSIKPWVDEMIVVDTGSIDNTAEICAEIGSRVLRFNWCEDFAAARNESLVHASGEWIFWMDSDDVIDAVNGAKLRALPEQITDRNIAGVVMQVRWPSTGGDGDFTSIDHVKLFRNHMGLRFSGRIHEQILPSLRDAGGEVVRSDIFVVHSGSDDSKEGRQRKRERDLRILNKDLEERPNHPFVLFNMGMTLADGDDCINAIDFLLRSIQKAAPQETHLRKAYALLVSCQSKCGRASEALVTCHEGLSRFPEDHELHFRWAMLLHDSGRLEEAVVAYQRLLVLPGHDYFASMVNGLNGYKARHNLACLFEEMGRSEDAENLWQEVLQEQPQFRPAWHGRMRVLLVRRDYGGARGIIEDMRRVSGTDCDRVFQDSMILEAELAMNLNQPNESVSVLERLVAQCPTSIDAQRALAKTRFELGRIDEAVDALKVVVELDPEDAYAMHNIGVACMRQKRPTEAIEWFEASLRHRPDHATTYEYLSDALTAVGCLGGAEAARNEALRLVEHPSK